MRLRLPPGYTTQPEAAGFAPRFNGERLRDKYGNPYPAFPYECGAIAARIVHERNLCLAVRAAVARIV